MSVQDKACTGINEDWISDGGFNSWVTRLTLMNMRYWMNNQDEILSCW
jgi:hypothetical protein